MTSGTGPSAIPRWAWIGAGLLVLGAGVAAVLLYIFLPPGTASFLLIAGVIVCTCGAGPVLLGAYSRQRAMRQRQEREDGEVIGDPRSGDQTGRS